MDVLRSKGGAPTAGRRTSGVALGWFAACMAICALSLLASGCQSSPRLGTRYMPPVEAPSPGTLHAGMLLPATVTASNTDYPVSSAWSLVDGSGMAEVDKVAVHDAASNGASMWRTTAGVSGRLRIDFDLGASYPVGRMDVWNYNLPNGTGAGLKDVKIYYSVGGFSWTELKGPGFPYRFARASGTANLAATNLDGTAHGAIDFGNVNARYVRFIVDAVPGTGNWGGLPGSTRVFGLSEVRFYAGTGFAAFHADDWTRLFVNYDGWVGADGIFSIPLSGYDRYGAQSERHTLFLFSDTFLGTVNQVSGQRQGNHLVNNTLALLTGVDPSPPEIRFIWGTLGDYSLDSVFTPLSRQQPMVGSVAANLANDSGMSGHGSTDDTMGTSPETMWLSGKVDKGDVSLDFDLGGIHEVSQIWVWNYNEEAAGGRQPAAWGLKRIKLEYSTDGTRFVAIGGSGYPFELARAPGADRSPATNLTIGEPISTGGVRARYFRISAPAVPGEGNWGGVEGEADRFGLSEVRFFGDDGKMLIASAKANSDDRSLSQKASSSRYWLQDGVVTGGLLHLFPLLVQNTPGGGAFGFEVAGVDTISVPVSDNGPVLSKAKQRTTPLYRRDGGTETIFGCGILNNTAAGGSFDPDGYIYVYGYKGQSGQKNLIAARVKPGAFGDFNEWRFWDGSGWSVSMERAVTIATHVSPELSVSSLGATLPEGRFILVYMKDSISGVICYRTADTPVGPFGEPHEIYVAPESLGERTIFTYNAKAHPHLSRKGELLVSYNVNSSDSSAFDDASIYHPRFIRLIAVRPK